jgi:hypothetical protein
VLGEHLRHYIRYQLYNNYFTYVEKTTFINDNVFSEQFFNIIRRQRRHLSIMMAFSPIRNTEKDITTWTFSMGLSHTESFSFQQYSNNDFFHNFPDTVRFRSEHLYYDIFNYLSSLFFFKVRFDSVQHLESSGGSIPPYNTFCFELSSFIVTQISNCDA